jgi:hypothetical protein
MNVALSDQIADSMRQRETDELLAIWQSNDRTQWSGAAFDAISQILFEREIAVPPHGVFVAAAPPYKGVRGWLLLLCVNLTILTPGRIMGSYGAMGVDVESIRGVSVGGLFSLAIAAFSIYVGVGLWRVIPGAVMRASIFLWTVFAWNLIIAATIFLTGTRFAPAAGPSAEALLPQQLVGALSAGIWLAYLGTSKRVKATYGLS